MEVITDEKQIEELLTRSVSEVFPSKKALKEKLLSGERMRVYIGIDATGPELHLGHSTNFLLLEKLRRLGHEVIVLFGDFTAMVGDPTGENTARKILTEQEVAENIKTWKGQLDKIINFSDSKNPAKIQMNSSWLSKLSFKEIIDIASNFTVQQMSERDMFEKRMKAGKPVYLHEFLYPLMQGYDSVAMGVDMEVGGNDQTFNMFVGRTLQKRYNKKEKYIIATTLLVNPKTGKKLMSKSSGSYIALNDTASEMYGKTMALPDEVIPQVFTDGTLVSVEEIKKIIESLEKGENPKNIKMRLAREIVSIYHGKESAEKAEENFVNTFSKKEEPEVFDEIKKEETLMKSLVSGGVLESTSSFRRLIEQGGITNLKKDEKVRDFKVGVSKGDKFKIGKKRFVKIV